MQTRKIAEVIEVEEVLDIIEQGFTIPVKCRLKNGMNVIVKYMKNPGGQQVLLNEWVGSNIADIIGLTIPEYGICDLTEKVIENTNYNGKVKKHGKIQRNFYSTSYTLRQKQQGK